MSTWRGPQSAETLHTLYPYDHLQEPGFEPVVAGPEQCTFQMVMHEVRANLSFAEVEPEDYLAIFSTGAKLRVWTRCLKSPNAWMTS